MTRPSCPHCSSALSIMAVSATSGPSRSCFDAADLFIKISIRYNLNARQPFLYAFLMCAIIPFTGACSYRLLVHDSLQPSCIFPRMPTFLPFFFALFFQLRCFRHPSRHRQYWDEAALPPSTALTPIPSILPRRHSSRSLHVSGFDSLRTFTRHTSSGTGPVSMTLSCMSSPSHVSSCRSFLPCWSSAFQGLPSLRIFFHPCSLFNLSIFSVPAFLHISLQLFLCHLVVLLFSSVFGESVFIFHGLDISDHTVSDCHFFFTFSRLTSSLADVPLRKRTVMLKIFSKSFVLSVINNLLSSDPIYVLRVLHIFCVILVCVHLQSLSKDHDP